MNATTEQIAKAKKAVETSKGKITLEFALSIIMKSDANKSKKINSKKNAAKWEQRENVANSTFKCDDLGEYNRANSMNNLPSSMR